MRIWKEVGTVSIGKMQKQETEEFLVFLMFMQQIMEKIDMTCTILLHDT